MDGRRPCELRVVAMEAGATFRVEFAVPPSSITLETTLGRALFNDTLPADYPYVNYEVGKKARLYASGASGNGYITPSRGFGEGYVY